MLPPRDPALLRALRIVVIVNIVLLEIAAAQPNKIVVIRILHRFHWLNKILGEECGCKLHFSVVDGRQNHLCQKLTKSQILNPNPKPQSQILNPNPKSNF